MQRKYFVYAVQSEAGVNTAEIISSLHRFKQNFLLGHFLSAMNIKAVKHSQAMCSVPLQAPACSLVSPVPCLSPWLWSSLPEGRW